MSTTAERPCLDPVAGNRWVMSRYLAGQAVVACLRGSPPVKVFLVPGDSVEEQLDEDGPDYGAVEWLEGTRPAVKVMALLAGAAAVDRHGKLLNPAFGMAPYLLTRDWVAVHRLALDHFPGSPMAQVVSRVAAAVRFMNHHRQAVELVATVLSENGELTGAEVVELVRLAEQPEHPPARADGQADGLGRGG